MLEKITIFTKRHFLLIICLVVAAYFRFLFLDKIPIAITGDELFYLLTAKLSFFIKTVWNPAESLLFFYPPHQFVQAELPYFLTPYYWLPIPFSLLISHLPGAIMSVLSVLFVYLIVKELCGKQIGYIAGFIAACNPWFIVIGRTFYEMNSALLFFLIMFYILLIVKKWQVLWAIPFFFLAFYSYIGTKLIAFPFLFFVTLYVYIVVNKRKFMYQYLIVLSVCFLFVLFYGLMLFIHPSSSRLGEILSPTNQVFTAQVDQIRKTTMQYPVITLFENKFIIFVFTLFKKIFATVAFDYLFMNGDLFFAQGHGLFYVIDAFFLILGIAFLAKRNLQLTLFLFLLIALGIIPQIVHGIDTQTFTPHIMLIFPFLIMFIASGIDGMIRIWKRKTLKTAIILLFSCIYMFFVGNFFITYFYRTPLTNATGFSERTVSHYIAIASQTKQVFVYSQSGGDLFKKYLFYANTLTRMNASQIETALSSSNPTIPRVQFLGCEKKLPTTNHNIVIIYSNECGGTPQLHGLQISQLSDGGGEYTIINDTVCKGVSINPYPTGLRIGDFAVEKLSQNLFCQKFVSTY